MTSRSISHAQWKEKAMVGGLAGGGWVQAMQASKRAGQGNWGSETSRSTPNATHFCRTQISTILHEEKLR